MKEEIEKYVTEILEAYKVDKVYGNSKSNQSFQIEYGRKFAKILRTSWGQTCVHCFVEIENGNIWKAATYKAPQKNGVRGNLKDAKRPLIDRDYYVNR